MPLIGLIIVAVVTYFLASGQSWPGMDVILLLFDVVVGKSAFVLLRRDEGESNSKIRSQAAEGRDVLPIRNSEFVIVSFLIGLVLLLAFSSWWHLDMSNNFYHGPRWMGLWDNPNLYGTLMSAGVVLAVGLLAAKQRIESRKQKTEVGGQKSQGGWNLLWSMCSCAATRKSAIGNWQSAMLFVAAGMMAVGLLCSYSRGAWLGTAIGLLYLARQMKSRKQKLESRNLIGSGKVFLFSIFCFLLLIFGVWFFWNTPRTAPWYWQRLDLSRGSVQHRLAAWKAGLEIMRDHPFGVGWNRAVDTYARDYSPPEGGALAITTNDYLMLGTQLGWPGLLCFVTYVGLCYRKCGVRSAESGAGESKISNS
ncbi:MAG TPA: O-antigen ligase family protein, partial [Verrucomicrobiae bacterium]|nr:O-antigen ligase family protein [Verrucomicrobiae bacterium]